MSDPPQIPQSILMDFSYETRIFNPWRIDDRKDNVITDRCALTESKHSSQSDRFTEKSPLVLVTVA